MHFLFVVPPFFGHISPTLSVGASLLARGHRVTWTGITPVADTHIPAGGKYVYPGAALAPYQDDIQRILKRQDDGPNISGPEALKLALEETYIPFCKYLMPGLEALVDEIRPDVIVNDCITFAGALCAYKKNIPCVTTTPVPPDLTASTTRSPNIFAWQQNLVRNLQTSVGVYSSEFHIHSKLLNIVFTSQEFAAVEEPEPQLKFVGPVKGRPNEVPFDWEKLAVSPYPVLYVSIGTLLVDIRQEFFSKVVEAFTNEPITVVCATPPEVLDVWPKNFIVQGFVPQTAVMQKADAVLCHGGFNTVNDCFLNGLPMVVTPIAYDQFHTAALIEKAGSGIKLRYRRLRVNDLRQAAWKILKEPAYKHAAVRVQHSFIKAGGNDTAVELLETFAAKYALHFSATA